jgi:hypothetical protein
MLREGLEILVNNNGGGGMHVFKSSNVTIASNSCFNNYLDPADNGSARACIDGSGGQDQASSTTSLWPSRLR